MENDKYQIIIDHLVKVTQEVTEIKLNLARIENEHGRKLDSLSKGLARIENNHGQKINALFDAWQVQQEVNNSILDRLTKIEGKLDVISVKVAQHDRILKIKP